MILVVYNGHKTDPGVTILGNVLKSIKDDSFEFFRLPGRSVSEYEKNIEDIKVKCQNLERNGKQIDLIIDLHTGFSHNKNTIIFFYLKDFVNKNISRFFNMLIKKKEKLETEIEMGSELDFDKSHYADLYKKLEEYGNRYVFFEVVLNTLRATKPTWTLLLTNEDPRLVKYMNTCLKATLRDVKMRKEMEKMFDDIKVVLLMFKEYFAKQQ